MVKKGIRRLVKKGIRRGIKKGIRRLVRTLERGFEDWLKGHSKIG